MNRRPASEILDPDGSVDRAIEKVLTEKQAEIDARKAKPTPTPWEALITVWIVLAVVLVGTIVVAKMLAADRAQQLAQLEQLKRHAP